MKFETLVTRYKNLGYTPQNLECYLEIASIIKWIYETHDIYIDVWFSTYDHGKYFKPPIITKNKFQGLAIWNTSKDYNNRFTSEAYFDDPYDAKFDAVRKFYKAIKFQKY